jgi:hypothetical protein
MNLTLAVDDELVRRARLAAQQQGTSLNALVRQYIETLAGERTGRQLVAELEELWSESTGRSHGRKWRREDAYDGRV